jgi:hypothetical protein
MNYYGKGLLEPHHTFRAIPVLHIAEGKLTPIVDGMQIAACREVLLKKSKKPGQINRKNRDRII